MVLHEGRVRFDGLPTELTALADGRVWTADRPAPDAVAVLAATRRPAPALGAPPAGAELAEPTLEDGYLLLVRGGRARCGEPA